MALFSRHDTSALDEYRASGVAGDARLRLMAQASGPRVRMLAFGDHFAVQYADRPWLRIGWHRVRSGGWRAEADEMHWRLVDGTKDAYLLAEPGHFPEVFRERVQASIALDEQFEAPGGGVVQVSARRDLARGAEGLTWYCIAAQGARMDDPAVRAFAERAEAHLRADYDL